MPRHFLESSMFRPIHPFSDYRNRFFCMKERCNALFFTEEQLANHDRFHHSIHPLGEGELSEEDRLDEEICREGVEEIAVLEDKGPTDEEKMYKTMVKMSLEFFDGCLGKARAFERVEQTEAEVVTKLGKE
jgi:hypothetical protein